MHKGMTLKNGNGCCWEIIFSMTISFMPYDDVWLTDVSDRCEYGQCRLCIKWAFYCILYVQEHLLSVCMQVRANHRTPAVSIGSDPWVGPWRVCVCECVRASILSPTDVFCLSVHLIRSRGSKNVLASTWMGCYSPASHCYCKSDLAKVNSSTLSCLVDS